MASTDPSPLTSRRVRFALGALSRTIGARLLAVFAFLGGVSGWLSQYDLALSQWMPPETAAKFPRAYQVAAMFSGWLSSWQFWTIGSLVLAFAAAVEYGVRAEMRGEQRSAQRVEAARKAAQAKRITYPPDAPISRLVAISDAVMDGFSKMLTESPRPKAPTIAVQPEPDPEPDWDKLYGLSEDGKDLRLLFLPDGEDVEGHTLLLVLYGYKIKLGLDRVAMGRAVTEASRAMRQAPNASWNARSLTVFEMVRVLEPEKYGTGAIGRGEIERVALSSGGQFEITWLGVDRADALARDLIRRA